MKNSSINIPTELKITEQQFEIICLANPDVRLERNAEGELIIMPPTGGNTGKRNMEIAFQLQAWTRRTASGGAFDSSTAFRLPNGANRSPDAAWISENRWAALTPKQQDFFPPLCPDFAIELRSSSDSLESLRQKMEEYIDNGLRLGWLIDPIPKNVEIYRPSSPVEVLANPTHLSGEDVLPDFVLDLALIFR